MASPTTPDVTGPPDKTTGLSARVKSTRARAEATRVAILEARPRHQSLDLGMSIMEHDRDVAGGVIAGAVAFRLFLWLLPAALVGSAILGFNVDSAEKTAHSAGLGGYTAKTISTAAAEAHRSRWVMLIVGLVLLFSVSRTLARTVTIAVALTWRDPVRRLRNSTQATLITIGVMALVILTVMLTGWMRSRAPGIGLIVTLLVFFLWSGLWWGVEHLLPHPPLPWWGLLPGAALFGVGAEIMHVAIVLYFSRKISDASPLYGSLSAAATLLLACYVISRLVVGSAALNATVHARHLQNQAALVEEAQAAGSPQT